MDIRDRISRLLSHIAKTNKLKEASGKQVGDLLTIEGNPHWIVFLSGSGRVDEDSYFLVDVDSEELSEICVDMSKTNPVIVAPEDINRRLSELIWKVKRNGWSRRGIKPEIERVVNSVKQYRGEQAIVTVPVWGLNLGDSSLVVGDVEFKPRPFPANVEEEVKLVDPKGIGISAIAITSSVGDQATIFANARTKINTAINVVRAFSFPIAHNNALQEISLEGDFRPLRSFGLLSYTGDRKPGTYVSALYNVGIGGVIPLDIKRYLPMMNLMGFGEFLEIISSPNKFSKRLMKAVDWLGEATKPDVLPAKFVKVAFSIDAMVGAEERNIPDAGKKARIAERAAFLMGRSYKARNMVWRAMGKIIEKRDEIAHGGSDVVITEVDVEEAGKYARGLLGELLLRAPRFKDVHELADWVRKQAFLG
jgi:hypothetical protein